jgi:arabinan endo-1,5-alpha-L-arabinosidase
MPSAFSIRTIVAVPLLWLAATTIPTIAGEPDASLISVYDGMTYETDPSDYTIHDPSRIITVGDNQMIAVTGKAQEDGYNCGLETWWRKVGGKGNWKPGQCLFRTKPSWVAEEAPLNDGAFWAPELNFKDGKLTLLYSVSEMDNREGGPNTCVGVASSTSLEGFPKNLTWEDAGEPLSCIIGSDYTEERSAIDPSVFWGFGENENKLFLVTGGGRIIGTELDPTSYLQKDGEWFDLEGDNWKELSTGPNNEDDTWVEAAYIHPNPKTGYYYLFVNWGACCSGVDSTYEIRVGRSTNPMGPFVDKTGKDMMEGGGAKLAKTLDFVIGPGHASVWENGTKQFLTFHYYDKRREGNSWIAERQLKWRNGWPKVKRRVLNTFPKNKLAD